jgi:hypothetical protein
MNRPHRFVRMMVSAIVQGEAFVGGLKPPVQFLGDHNQRLSKSSLTRPVIRNHTDENATHLSGSSG